MKIIPSSPRLFALASACALVLASAHLPAQTTYTWVSPSTGGSWGTSANWSPAAVPIGSTASVVLGDATANRVVTFSGSTGTPVATSGTEIIGSLALNQTSPFNNQLTVQSALRVNSGFTLSASTGGTSTLFLANNLLPPTGGTTTPKLTFTLGASAGQTLSVGTNGVLALGGSTVDSAFINALDFNTGNISLDGGRLDVQQAVKTASGSGGTVNYNLNGALTINSGTLTMGAASSLSNLGNGFTTQARILVKNNFTMNGGAIDSPVTSQIWLQGATNTIASGSTVSGNTQFVMNSGTQSLTSAAGLSTIILRGSNITTTLGVTGTRVSGANVGQVQFITSGTSTLKLGTDIATDSLFSVSNGSGNVNYVIDTNGHTLDLTRANARFEPAQTAGTNTQWSLIGSGTVKAHSFRFDLNTNVGVSVGSGTTLIATANNVTNFLGYNTALAPANQGTYAADSIFIYDGGSGATGFISSNRAIGKVVARTGTLQMNTAINAQSGVAVEAGAVFNASTFALTTPSLAFGVNGANFGTFTAASTYSIAGQNLFFDFGTTPVNGTSFDFFTSAISGSAANVSVTFSGLNAIALTSASGTWTGSGNGFDYAFVEGTGILSVSTSSVPEPSTTALLIGGAVLGICAFRRKSLRARA